MNAKWLMNYGEHVGLSHLPNNIPCQDKALCKSGNGVHVAVLSDGCGSSALSQYGSEIVVNCLCDLFISKFDKLCGESTDEIIFARKTIIDTIGLSYKKFIDTNRPLFDQARIDNKEKYSEYIARKSNTEYDYDCDCLNATALFVATKGDQYIIGQIGDGIIGGLFENHTKILMEEVKMGEANQTFYPISIYNFGQKDPKWYNVSQFVLKTPKFVTYEDDKGETKQAKFDGFFLMSDGVDGLLDKTIAFQKKFTKGVGTFLTQVIQGKPEETQNMLLNEFLPRLTKYSNADDDCSLAFLVRPNAVCNNPVNIVKQYPRVEVKEDEIGEVSAIAITVSEHLKQQTKTFDDELKEILSLDKYNDILTEDSEERSIGVTDFTSAGEDINEKLKNNLINEVSRIKAKIAELTDLSLHNFEEKHLPQIYNVMPLKMQLTSLSEVFDFLTKVRAIWGEEYKIGKKEKNIVKIIADFKFKCVIIDEKTVTWN